MLPLYFKEQLNNGRGFIIASAIVDSTHCRFASCCLMTSKSLLRISFLLAARHTSSNSSFTFSVSRAYSSVLIEVLAKNSLSWLFTSVEFFLISQI